MALPHMCPQIIRAAIALWTVQAPDYGRVAVEYAYVSGKV